MKLALFICAVAFAHAIPAAFGQLDPILPYFDEPHQVQLGPENSARKFINAEDNKNGRKQKKAFLGTQRDTAHSTFQDGSLGAVKNRPASRGSNVERTEGIWRDGKNSRKSSRIMAVDFGEGVGKAAVAGKNKVPLRELTQRNGNQMTQSANGAANGEPLNMSVDKTGNKITGAEAKGRKNQWEMDVDNTRNNNRYIEGKLIRKGKKPGVQEYEVDQNPNTANARLNDPNPGRFKFDKRCKVERIGESICTDQNGNRIGKVVTDSDLNAVVYGSLGRTDVPVGRAKCNNFGEFDRVCEVGQGGIFTAEQEEVESTNCMGDFGLEEDADIEFGQLKFNYDKKLDPRSGAETFEFPACFDASTNVQLKNFDNPDYENFGARLAIQWNPSVSYAGNLTCADKGTCSDVEDTCYYCDWCDEKKRNEKLKPEFGNFDATALCGYSGQAKQRLKTRICPPPEAFDWPNCYVMKSSVGSNYDLVVTQFIYLMPKNIETIRSECRTKVRGFGKALMAFEPGFADYKAKKLLAQKGRSGFGNQFSDEELFAYCVADRVWEAGKRAGYAPNNRNNPLYDYYKGKLVGCKRSKVNFKISGTKGARQAGQWLTTVNGLKKKPCKI